jgi:NADH dehydrogenase
VEGRRVEIDSVSILGGSGFVGRHLTARLVSCGVECRVVTRNLHRHRDIQAGGGVTLVEADPFEPGQLETAIQGTRGVVNLVGILNESGTKKGFQRTHVELGNRVVEACKDTGISRLLHMSALNANESNGPSVYLKTKGEAENRTHTLGQPHIKVTSFRPSVIFGPDDSFFNRFADLLRTVPGPFPLACPEARFAPVYVGDVAAAFAVSLNERKAWGKHYQLCGPRSFSLKELVEYTARHAGIRKRIIGLSDSLSRLQARVMGMVPGRPFTYDNYLSLQVDSLCTSDGLAELGINATDIDAVAPFFLAPRAQRTRYQFLRKSI